MSGKKRSEVIDVLEAAKKARAKTNDSLDSSIKRDSESVADKQEELKNIKKELKENEELSKEASDIFGIDGEQQVKQSEQLLQELRKMEIVATCTKSATAKLKKIEEQLGECDKEAASIRSAVASKPHYCDEEFKRAKQLKKRYEELSEERKLLADNIKRESIVAGEKVSDARRLRNELKNCQDSVKKLNIIAKNRVQADEWKETLRKTLKEIPLDEARKFKKFDLKEFVAIKNKVEKLICESAEYINENAAGLMNELDSFKAEVVNKVQLWEKQKADAEALFKQISLTKDECFVDPVDEFQNGVNAEKIALFEYIARYVETDYYNRFIKFIKNAEANMEQENYIEAYKQYEQANIIVNEAKNKALSLQETMFKNLDIAQKIDEAMYSLGYDVNTQIINDNPYDGFRILCSCGDEIIDFTRIAYDENGKPIVDIDHTESRTGTCGKSWESIVRTMREQGLPIDAPYLANGERIWHDPKHSTNPETEPSPGVRKHS